MSPLIGALILILLGLLGARLSLAAARAPLGARLILASGTHFIFLGFLLGDHVFDLFNRSLIDQLYPFLALGIGWIGFLFGLQLDRRHLRRFPPRYLMITILQAVLAFAIFLALGSVLLSGADAWGEHRTLALFVTAATACVSTPAGIALISHSFLVRGNVSQLLYFIASLDAVVGIIALQITYAFQGRATFAPAGAIVAQPIAWIGLAVLLGAVFGVLFLWITWTKPGSREMMLFLLGLVLFAGGAALYLGLSPLFVATIAGAIVANLSPLRRRAYALLQAWEQPIYVILLILAGALLTFPTWFVVPLALGYLLVRVVAKLVASYLATHAVRLPFRAPAEIGAGLVSQGGISLAMVVSVVLTYGALELDGRAIVDVVFSTVVLGVMASELAGPFLTQRLLRDAGEIKPRAEPVPADGSAQGETARGRARRIRERGGGATASEAAGEARGGNAHEARAGDAHDNGGGRNSKTEDNV